jgi:His-Xaa-Ser system radical SAM maturase HxsB
MTAERTFAKGFHERKFYRKAPEYSHLPFRFFRLANGSCLLTNIVGEYIVVSSSEFEAFVESRLDQTNETYHELKSKHFLFEGDPSVPIELLAAKYRTQKANLPDLTALHIFVVTLRCDHSCHYCQVSRVSEDKSSFDMTPATAIKAIDLMLQSPSKYLKVEFQGGESLLNFGLIKLIVEQTKAQADGRTLDFVIASNLSHLTDEILWYAKEHRINFSCSLDGQEALHNANRPLKNAASYKYTIEGIAKIRDVLGHNAVSALMTTTAESLKDPRPLIDEYIKQGFDSVFLRWISPFGFALKTERKIGYETEKYIDFFRRGLDYILELNLAGTFLREEYASIILHKILRPYAHGYVDLQSPAGLGLSVMVYNYDGDVYASDEGRMLAEMGDKTFRLGNVHTSTYEEIFFESPVLEIASATMLEGAPGCSDCAFLPFCGADPVFHHATQCDMVGNKPTSAFCERNMAIIQQIFEILHTDPKRAKILRSWI